MKLGVQQLADFDQAVRDMNRGIVELHNICEHSHEASLLWREQMCAMDSVSCAVQAGDLTASQGLVSFAHLLRHLADAVRDCEETHPGDACHTGMAAMFAFGVPMRLTVAAAMLGLTFARGKRIE